ncbi:MoxR family ATPase [Syntrophotalea carbinolica DSM 2380]|uniref:MoxR family ATPase n=1 Tax=Syntrophotalea carbinolica (strain DSM 2380 / NBRC 103641 / GraBd1) TaxID=338963 RepID=Q3A2W2_SYNC1|nr:MoxR family ATPase [Syntrophotalea carbinolica]ABA89295.1 MoxR family ATPase [Syntrophotalea carbinolica DSM 2380]
MTREPSCPIRKVLQTLDSEILQGKERALRLSFIALLAGGHVLIEDLPGLGKTTLALALASVLGLSFGRVQCTSDLLPSDITGLSIYDRDSGQFRFIKGPIFNNILLADEINRAMPKTQSAMLEAMEERRVTVEGTTHPLPDPFLVIATQNPVEQIGTYPLPESQLDRFLLVTGVGYPPENLEKEIIRNGGLHDQIRHLDSLLSHDELLTARRKVREVQLGNKLVDYIFALVAKTREHPYLISGLSTRGGLNLAAAARAAAYLDGRDYVIPEDVQLLAVPVGAHRLLLRPEHESLSKSEVLRSIVDSVPVPRA